MFDYILVGDLEGAFDLVDKLKQLGLAASCYTPLLQFPGNPPCEAIWVGGSVTPDVAITAIKTAVTHWPTLKYVHLSCDGGGSPDEASNYHVFLGGLTDTALRHGCRPWSPADFERLQCGMPLPAFHYSIRRFYGRSQGVATFVRVCGGPGDGQVISFAGPPDFLPRSMRVGSSEYRLRKVGDDYEYHPASTTGEIHPDEIRDPGGWGKIQAENFRIRFGQHFIVVFKKGGNIEEDHVYDSRSGREEDIQAVTMVVGLLAHAKPIGPEIIGQGSTGVFPWTMKEAMRKRAKLTDEERSRFLGTVRVTGVSVDDPEKGVTTIYMEAVSP